MSYVVKQTKQRKYMIYDNDKELYINMEMNKRDANTTCRKLNLGSGFEGFIPNFFNLNLQVKE